MERIGRAPSSDDQGLPTDGQATLDDALAMGLGGLRVLCVGCETDATALVARLAYAVPSAETVFVRPGQQAIDAIAEAPFDLALIQVESGARGERSLIRALMDARPPVPVLAWGSATEEVLGDEAVALGAQDFLVCDEHSDRSLARAIRYAIARHCASRRTLGVGLADNFPDLVARFNSQVELVHANAAALRWHAANSDAAAGLVGLWREHICAVLAKGETLEVELDLPDPRGTRYLLAAFVPELNHRGEVQSVVAVARDITPRKVALQALSESESRYRRLAENLPDVVWRADPEGGLVFVSSAVEAMLGVKPEEALRLPFRASLDPLNVGGLAEWFRGLGGRGSGRRYIGEVSYTHADGRTIPAEVHAIAVFDEDGALVAVEGVTRDITDRKRAEEESAKLHEQLVQAQKMEAIGTLAGGVAHDFNNLLSVVLGYADLGLQVVKENDSLQRDLQAIKAAGERAAALTRQLLAFGRKQMLKPTPIDLNAIARDVSQLLRSVIGEDIVLELRLQPAIAPAMADRAQIEQVIVNLVVNARDAMPSGGSVTIETATVGPDAPVDPETHVMLAVSDTGVGMDAATMEHAFEPFFSTKPKDRGTGLGLSMVYGIVSQSGGRITVESEIGKGTTFALYLPRAPVEAAPARPSKTRVGNHGGTETILVVEDNEWVRDVAVRILSRAGYRVIAAASGGEALSICDAHPEEIDLVLTDVVMPMMGGKELALRLLAIRPRIKVLFMSGYAASDIVHQGVLDSGVELIRKPFVADELVARVRDLLDGST